MSREAQTSLKVTMASALVTAPASVFCSTVSRKA